MKLRTQNLILSLRCFALLLLRGGVKAYISLPPKKILIVQNAKLGDMVCTTPMFRAIKKRYPEAKLWVVGDALNREILVGNPDVDEYRVCGSDVYQIARELRKQRFDFGCVTGPDLKGLAVLILAGVHAVVAPRVEGGRSLQTRTYRVLKWFVIQKSHRMGSYAPREYLRLLEPLNIFTEDTTKHLFFSEEAGQRVRNFIENQRIEKGQIIVGVSPSAGNKIKQWPLERFAAVIDYLVNRHKAKVFVIGGRRDEEQVREVMELVTASGVVNTLNRFSIEELKAFISNLDLFISVDTGPIYIAEAFGVATVDIVGPMDENEQPPRGSRHRVVVPERREPALHIMNAREYDFAEARRQAEAISVESIVRVVDELLASR